MTHCVDLAEATNFSQRCNLFDVRSYLLLDMLMILGRLQPLKPTCCSLRVSPALERFGHAFRVATFMFCVALLVGQHWVESSRILREDQWRIIYAGVQRFSPLFLSAKMLLMTSIGLSTGSGEFYFPLLLNKTYG